MLVGILVFPNMTALDALGPYEVFSHTPNTDVLLVSTSISSSSPSLHGERIVCDKGLRLSPDVDLASCPPLDVVCVPGGAGQLELMENAQVLSWIREQARGKARYACLWMEWWK